MRHGHPPGWAPEEIGLFIDSKCRGGTPLPAPDPIEVKGDVLAVPCVSATALEEAALTKLF